MKALCIILFALTLGLTGCVNRGQSKNIAGEVEENFKSRWIAQRMNELQASGAASNPRDARQIALEEFRKRYEYTGAARKADPVRGSEP